MVRELRKSTVRKTQTSLNKYKRTAASKAIFRASTSFEQAAAVHQLRKSTKENTQTSCAADTARKASNEALKSTRTLRRNRRDTCVHKTADRRVSGKTPLELQHITMANATLSPLLRLPAELRNKIWERVATVDRGQVYLDDETVTEMEEDGMGPHVTYREVIKYNLSETDNRWEAHGFLAPRACRQMYHELGTMAYSKKVFIVDFDHEDTLTFVRSRIPAQRKVLKERDYVKDRSGRIMRKYNNMVSTGIPGMRVADYEYDSDEDSDDYYY